MNGNSANMRAYLVLAGGVGAASFAATFIRLAQGAGMSSLSIAAIRLLLVTLLYTPLALRRGGGVLERLTQREWSLIALAGVFLAFHFTTFISALEYTAVLTSLVLSSTTPLYAAFLGWVVLQERVRPRVLFGVVLALAGIVLVGMGGNTGTPSTRPAPLLGGALAIASAVLLASYFTVGRFIRGKLDWLTYSWLVFAFAALTMLVLLPVTGNSVFGYTLEAYQWVLLVTLFAQVIGHTSFNFALGQLSATLVSLVMMVVPVGAAIVAALILGEIPNTAAVIGSGVVLSGVALANLSS